MTFKATLVPTKRPTTMIPSVSKPLFTNPCSMQPNIQKELNKTSHLVSLLGSVNSVNASASPEQRQQVERENALLCSILRSQLAPVQKTKTHAAFQDHSTTSRRLLALAPRPAVQPQDRPEERLLFLQDDSRLSHHTHLSIGHTQATGQPSQLELQAQQASLSFREKVVPPMAGVSQTASKTPPEPKKHFSGISEFQVFALKQSERKAGFCLPCSRDPSKSPAVGALAKYRRTWSRLKEKAATSSALQENRFVREFFARRLFSEDHADHMYRKIHRLPTSSDFALPPTKRTRYS